MTEIENQMRQTVKKLFDEKKIDLFIGYEEGSLPMTATPCFISSSDACDRLVWNSYCSNNLSVYLPKYFIPNPRKKDQTFPRIGMVAKGCDGRSAVGLIKENQLPRENLFIVGIPCGGMISKRKVESLFEPAEPSSAEIKSDAVMVTSRTGEKKTFKNLDILDEACLLCQHTTPNVYDILLGDGAAVRENCDDAYGRTHDFESKSLEKRWNYFEEEMSKCIRCYACRNACPNCYCQECFAEATEPKWIGATDNLSDVIVYHLGRLFHQTGRCVDCGACDRACPMGIDLGLFVRKLGKDVKELYGYEAGLALEDPPPLTTFKDEDSQKFITEP